MNIIPRYLCLILVSLCAHLTQAQPIDSAIKAIVTQLQRQKIDTIVEFQTPQYDHLFDDTVPSLGIIHCFAFRYLLYRLHGTVCSRKFIDYCDSDCSQIKVAVSKVYTTANDSLFTWLHANLDSIWNEELFPYISTDTINGVPIFFPYIVDHIPEYYIWFHLPNAWFGKSVNTNDLEERAFRQPENLNFRYNRRTRLSKLFYLLEAYRNAIDSKYVF